MKNVYQMINDKGKPVNNHMIIETEKGTFLKSYNSIVCFVSKEDSSVIFGTKYNYSKTTAKYRNMFLRLTSKEIEQGIKKGIYTIDADLNII